MKRIYTKNKNNKETIEVMIPQSLRDKDINRIAWEYGTLVVCKKHIVLRTTFYNHDIDRTLRSYRIEAFNKLKTRKWLTNEIIPDYKLILLIENSIRKNWLMLISKGD